MHHQQSAMQREHQFHPSYVEISVGAPQDSEALTKNIIEGAAARAFLNVSRTARSDSPTNLFRSL